MADGRTWRVGPPEQPEGVTRVRDEEGDIWRLNTDSNVWQCPGLSYSWERLVESYGPLTEDVTRCPSCGH